jgi:hypothetical protein
MHAPASARGLWRQPQAIQTAARWASAHSPWGRSCVIRSTLSVPHRCCTQLHVCILCSCQSMPSMPGGTFRTGLWTVALAWRQARIVLHPTGPRQHLLVGLNASAHVLCCACCAMLCCLCSAPVLCVLCPCRRQRRLPLETRPLFGPAQLLEALSEG